MQEVFDFGLSPKRRMGKMRWVIQFSSKQAASSNLPWCQLVVCADALSNLHVGWLNHPFFVVATAGEQQETPNDPKFVIFSKESTTEFRVPNWKNPHPTSCGHSPWYCMETQNWIRISLGLWLKIRRWSHHPLFWYLSNQFAWNEVVGFEKLLTWSIVFFSMLMPVCFSPVLRHWVPTWRAGWDLVAKYRCPERWEWNAGLAEGATACTTEGGGWGTGALDGEGSQFSIDLIRHDYNLQLYGDPAQQTGLIDPKKDGHTTGV